MSNTSQIKAVTGAAECSTLTARDSEHRVQFYRDDRFLGWSVAEHLAGCLQTGGSALLLATPRHNELILEELGKREVPADTVLKRCLVFDAAQALQSFVVHDQPDPARFDRFMRELIGRARSVSEAEACPIAAFGEMVAVLWAEGKREAAVQLEQLWTGFTRAHSLSLLCAYPLAYFSRQDDHEVFARICSEHTSVAPAEGFALEMIPGPQAREIAQLQQRAESLALEIRARHAAEEQLRIAHAELETAVEQRTHALRQLSLQVLKLQDLERRRIARELHDSLGQDFVGLKLNLNLARRNPGDAALWAKCDQLLEHCIAEVRTLSYLLHPPMIEDAGFESAAEWYVQDFSHRSGLSISFSSDADVGALPEPIKLVLFRVLQESLMNIYRHAHARQGRVRVWREDNRVLLEIQDDGVGIRQDKLARFNRNGTGMGVGLTSLWERVSDVAGHAELISGATGTTVRISVPSESQTAAEQIVA